MKQIEEDTLLILIAPNVGEQMGGEGIKALHIFQEMKKLNKDTIQVTHERNTNELKTRLSLSDVYYVKDTPLAIFLWRSRIFSKLLDPWFCYKAVKLAEALAKQLNTTGKKVIIHQTEPNSPVIPRTISKSHINVFGPINGNIYYPPIFRYHESISARLRRIFHMPLQRFNRFFFKGLPSANLILCAGGERTRASLIAAGCSPDIIMNSLDCGIKDEILSYPRAEHEGSNFHFFHYGRTFHKGTFLVIEALSKTKNAITVDVVGMGSELERYQRLAQGFGVADRVRFLARYTKHSDLLNSLRQYRGGVLPSFEDANGIVVQEAMALGLPMICLDWGGPQLLVENGVSGYLIKPNSKDYVVSKLAENLDQLSTDGALAEKMSIAARKTAEEWRWSRVSQAWFQLYGHLAGK